MKHLFSCVIMILLSLSTSFSYCNSTGDPISFNLSQSNYSVYEGEFITFCLEGPTGIELTSLSESSLELEIIDGWSNFNNPNRKIAIREGKNCLHLKAKPSEASSNRQYVASFSSKDENVSVPEDIALTVNKIGDKGLILNNNDLYIKGIDSSIDEKGSDKIIIGNSKTNYYQNMSMIRKNLREGVTFKDASWFRPKSELAPTLRWPTRTVGQTFYGAERNLMQNRVLWPR